jgi:ComF family protein
MKYQRIYGLVRPLGALLAAHFAWHWGSHQPELLVPIPLHRTKLRQREFDQALALAAALSQGTGIPLAADVLVRQRATVSQVGLTAAQRRQNVRGAFHLKVPHACAGKAILLIDDVYTTGATIRECARLFRQAGARWVGAYTLARVG